MLPYRKLLFLHTSEYRLDRHGRILRASFTPHEISG